MLGNMSLNRFITKMNLRNFMIEITPVSGKELKRRLFDVRGVDENMQIHPNECLVGVGNNIWGLSEW